MPRSRHQLAQDRINQMYESGILIQNPSLAVQLAQQRMGYTNPDPVATSLLGAWTWGFRPEWQGQTHETEEMIAGGRDGRAPGTELMTEVYQARNMNPPSMPSVTRNDYINPVFQTATNPFAGNAGDQELLVNGAAGPLPFVSDNLDEIEFQAMQEHQRSAMKDALSNTFALATRTPMLEQAVIRRNQANAYHKSVTDVTRQTDSSAMYYPSYKQFKTLGEMHPSQQQHVLQQARILHHQDLIRTDGVTSGRTFNINDGGGDTNTRSNHFTHLEMGNIQSTAEDNTDHRALRTGQILSSANRTPAVNNRHATMERTRSMLRSLPQTPRVQAKIQELDVALAETGGVNAENQYLGDYTSNAFNARKINRTLHYVDHDIGGRSTPHVTPHKSVRTPKGVKPGSLSKQHPGSGRPVRLRHSPDRFSHSKYERKGLY